MVRTLLATLLALSALPALAADSIIFQGDPGGDYYARIRTSSTASVAVALTEGTSNGVGFYTATDAEVTSAGLTDSGKTVTPYKVLEGSTPSTSAADTMVAGGLLLRVAGVTVDDAAATWSESTRVLTALDEDTTTIDLNASLVGGIAGTITTLDALDTAQDTQHSTTQGLVTTADTAVDSIVAKLPSAGANMAGEGATAKNLDQIDADVTLAPEDIDEIIAGVTDAIEAALAELDVEVDLTPVTDLIGTPAVTLAADIATRLATAGYTAPPAVATVASAVRTELTTELGRIDVATSTRASQASVDGTPAATNTALLAAATSDTGAGTIGRALHNLRQYFGSSTAGVASPTALQNAPSGEGGSVVIPVNQVRVADSRTWILKPTTNGLVGELTRSLSLGDSKPFAVDFRNDLTTNGQLTDVSAIVVVDDEGEVIEDGGVTFADTDDDPGVDRTQAKVTITGNAVGTYRIRVTVDVDESDGGGSSSGTVTLVVAP